VEKLKQRETIVLASKSGFNRKEAATEDKETAGDGQENATQESNPS